MSGNVMFYAALPVLFSVVHVCVLDELGPFLSKEKATSYLQGRSKRIKRDINEECRESGGCNHEEILENGVRDVCAWMKNRLCNELNCAPGYVCVTIDEDSCRNLNYYRVGCEVCQSGYYGKNCINQCSINCDTIRNCDRFTGKCDRGCTQGWTGIHCDQVCQSGYYGKNCINQCSINCDTIRNCDRFTGKCDRGCTQGWTGIHCDQVCESGSYGKDCRHRCSVNCSIAYNCDQFTGQCIGGCKPGWTGIVCDQVCESGYYGKNCVNQCSINCDTIRSCDRFTGECDRGCTLGWRGIHCDQECMMSYYGKNCSNLCSAFCHNTERCDKITGCCDGGCKPGWTGNTCDQMIKCKNGYFGPECSRKCGHCLESKHCHHMNGSCLNGCSHGYRGDLCNETCPSGFFGLDCINRCDTYCTGNESCDPVIGICNEGCKKGWSGLMCDLDRFSDRQSCGDNTPIVIGVVLSVVIVIFGSVINFIYWRRKTAINVHARQNNSDPKADNKDESENTSQQYTELGEVNKSSNYDDLYNYSN